MAKPVTAGALMKKLKLVMVGNGMAGVRTLEELIKIAPDVYDITVFGAEPHPNYNRILLSPVLAGEQTVQDIILNDYDWYADNNITLHVGKKIVKIDRAKRVVIAEDGTTAEYDRLLLATGSNPFMLPVPGKDLKGVIGYRDIADTNAMIEASHSKKHAIVIGGGLLGLEAANGLKLRGMDVTVVHLPGWLMERQLDPVAGQMLKKSLEERIAEFQRKSELIEKRTLFQLKQDTLLDVMKRMGSDFDAELESNDFKLVLRNSNHREDVISIANNDLIYEFLRMLSLKIREKVQSLENEILQ
jgi:NAD(P)H-nitrite reductase large subunit